MKKIIFLIGLSLLTNISFSTQVGIESIKSYNGVAGTNDYLTDIHVLSNGSIYSCGYSTDKHSSRGLLIKYNSSLAPEWTKIYRHIDNGMDHFFELKSDSENNLYILGGSRNINRINETVLIKYSANGDVLWERRLSSNNNFNSVPVKLDIDQNGDLIVLSNNGISSDRYKLNLTKFNSTGNIIWNFELEEQFGSSGTTLEIDSNGNSYIMLHKYISIYNSEKHIIKLSSSGDLLWDKYVSGNFYLQEKDKIKVLDNNRIVYFSNSFSTTFTQVNIHCVDSTGMEIWTKEIPMDFFGSMSMNDVDADENGNLYLATVLVPIITDLSGNSLPGYMLLKYSSNGDSLWNSFKFCSDVFNGWNAFVKVKNQNEIYFSCLETVLKNERRIYKIDQNGFTLNSGIFFEPSQYGSINQLVLYDNNYPLLGGTIIFPNRDYDHTLVRYSPDCQVLNMNNYNSSGFSSEQHGEIVEDSSGNYYVTGRNLEESFLIKYDSDLNEEWISRVNLNDGFRNVMNAVPLVHISKYNEIFYATTINTTGHHDILVRKYLPNGNIVWSKIISTESTNDHLRHITSDEEGNIFITGYHFSSSYNGKSYIAKMSSGGTLFWKHDVTGVYYYNKTVVSGGNLYFMGNNVIEKRSRYNGQLFWMRTYQPNSLVNYFRDIAIDKEGNLIACGSGNLPPQGFNYIIVKYSASGDMIWDKYYNGDRNYDDEALSIKIDTLNNIVVSGNASETPGFFKRSITTLKFDPEGNQLWKKTLISENLNDLKAGKVKLDKYDNVYVSSGVANSHNPLWGYTLTKYRSNGDSLWTINYVTHDRTPNQASDFLVSKSHDVIVTGIAYGTNTSYDLSTIRIAQVVNITNENSSVPDKYSLSQNFPNPFNPVTKIEFTIPEQAHVKLSVFDITGRQVSVIVNQEMSSGRYSFDFTGRDLSSGVYFYKMQAGKFTQVKRMLLIK